VKAPGRGILSQKGTIAKLVAAYYGSAEWKALGQSSKYTHRRILSRFAQQYGEGPVAELETHHINAILDAAADHPAAANNLRDRPNLLMKFARMESQPPRPVVGQVIGIRSSHSRWARSRRRRSGRPCKWSCSSTLSSLGSNM
jgi:hypothetical protein